MSELRNMRLARGWTLEEAAKRGRLSRSGLDYNERGLRAPLPATVKRLAWLYATTEAHIRASLPPLKPKPPAKTSIIRQLARELGVTVTALRAAVVNMCEQRSRDAA